LKPVPVPPESLPPLVMVVDDSLTVRKVSSRLLEREGYRVITAKDGVDALEKLADVLPDVMLVDIEMPRMDGFDLTLRIRADARTHARADHHDHVAHGRKAPHLRAADRRQ
jgi:chemosensory pili system protein ChpA (sensor histidine kinase/response regulator)